MFVDGDADFEMENDDFEYDTPSEDDGGDWRRPAKKKVNSTNHILKHTVVDLLFYS